MLFSGNRHSPHIMSWRHQWTLNNRVRGWIHPPERIFSGLVEPGMTVVDTGCGTGFFTLALARMVGDKGKVIGVDVQPEALAKLEKKAEARGLSRVIETWFCDPTDIGTLPRADFVLSFYMAHEVPDLDAYFNRMAQCLNRGGKLLLVEPCFHVTGKGMDRELAAARKAGFSELDGPRIAFSRSRLLKKP